MKGKLVVDVVDVAEEGNVHAVRHELDLLQHGGSKLVAVVDSAWRLRGGLGNDAVEFLADLVVLGRCKPHLVPVLALRERAGNDVNHVLGGIDLLGARSAVATKVVLDRLGMFANIAKVDRLAALGEEKEGIELGEQLGRGLVDGDEDGLADGSKLSKEADRVVRRLTIETRGRLVEEDQDTWLGNKFNANGDALALLNTQSSTDLTNKSIGKVVKLEEIDNGVDILELLRARGVTALAKQGRKFQRLSHGGIGLMDIKLLAVTGRSLE